MVTLATNAQYMDHSGFNSAIPGTVSAVFFSKSDADNAYRFLLQCGHSEDDISILMSDETLSDETLPQAVTEGGREPDGPFENAANQLTEIVISFTSLISIPGVGIAISNAIKRRLSVPDVMPAKADAMRHSGIPETHHSTYDSHLAEGGMILSVDPKNAAEKRAIIQNFRLNNGHDILGDDGYTDLD